jgi:multicomponent Na+:H+ antiporter subunit E
MIWNLLLALVWAALWNDFSATNLFIGFVVGFAILVLFASRGVLGPARYVVRARRALGFLGFYLLEIVLSNLRLARDVIRLSPRAKPAVVAFPLDPRMNTDAEITLFANLLSLTPGTLALDLSPDRRTLYVHVMDVEDGDLDRWRKLTKDELERRVLEVLH